MRIAHVAGEALLQNTGFSQQFFMEVKELSKRGHDVSVMAFIHLKYFRRREPMDRLREKYAANGVEFHAFPTFLAGRMVLGFLYFPVAWMIYAYFILSKGVEIFHFHESHYLVMFLLPKFAAPKKVKAFNDIHGVVIEESIYQGRLKEGSIRHRQNDFLEKAAMNHADMNFCVSMKMIEYYIEKHGVSADGFALTRSSFDPDIFRDFSLELKRKSKAALGIEDRKVILYMGHKRGWQQTKEVISLFAYLGRHIEGLFLLFLTDDAEAIENECRQAGIGENDRLVRYVPHDEIPRYSLSADVAILIRDDSIVNRAASPVKFSEYLASGAAVILTDNIGDLPAIVREHGVGAVMSPGGHAEMALYLKDALMNENARERLPLKCREVAECEFSARKTIDTFIHCYGTRSLRRGGKIG